MPRLLATLAVVATVLGSCDRNQPPAAPHDKVAGVADNAVPDANPAATIRTRANEASTGGYVAEAAASDLFQIESSRIAEKRAVDPEVRTFAGMMVKAHQNSLQGLRIALSQSGATLTLQNDLPRGVAESLDELKQENPQDFDRSFMEAQIKAHQDALNLHSRYANVGDSPALKTFAIQTAPVVQKHLDRARSVVGRLR